MPRINFSVLGDFSTQFLVKAIKGYAFEYGYNFEIYEADYDQVDLQVFNSESELYSKQSEFVLLAESYLKIQKLFYKSPLSERHNFATDYVNRIANLHQNINDAIAPKAVMIFNIIEEDDGVFGNFGNKVSSSFLYQIRKINFLLMDLAIQNPSLHIVDVKKIHQRLGDKQSFSYNTYISTDILFSLDITPIIAKNVCDISTTLLGKFKKCLILDLDNTMWGGVIGDDGLKGIEIGSLGIGKAFTNFQKWAKELKNRGIILAVCSKNFEDVAKTPFERHPDMILKLEDISVFVANWNNKADNIKYIQSILNIGFDSMVFLDDNKFERELVKSNIPNLEVPELPEDPAEYINYLKGLNLFETASYSQNDLKRTLQYQEESKRKNEEMKFSNQDDFLKSLNMEAKIEPFNDFNLPRIAQLIQRSNQFNVRTIRYSEQELSELAKSENHICFSVSLKDVYGDTGLISVIILKKSEDNLFIDTWVMSCRVLKRGVEGFIANYIINLAKKIDGIKQVEAEVIPTAKNHLVKDLYLDLNFEKKDDIWILKMEDSGELKCFIKTIGE